MDLEGERSDLQGNDSDRLQSDPIIVEEYEQAFVIAAQLVRRELVLGFDTETTVPTANQTNIQGKQPDVSLIQLSNGHRTWLFRMLKIGSMPPPLRSILTANVPVKVGVGLDNDFVRIERQYGFRPWGFIDLQHIALSLGHPDVGFDGLCRWSGINETPPGLRHEGNWDLPKLSPNQVRYASYDAWACLAIYHRILGKGVSRSEKPVIDRPTNDERLALLQWLQVEIDTSRQSCTRPRTIQSLVNQAVNSYGPWRNRWVTVDRRSLIEETVQQGLQTGRLCLGTMTVGSAGKAPLTSPSEPDEKTLAAWTEELTQCMRSRVKGLSRKSAINMMINGYGGWSQYAKDRREHWAMTIYDRWHQE